MAISFLPGEPNRSPNACSFANWNSIQILAYITGNNLVILTKNCHHLQTIYLPGDAFAVDVNRVNGKIALVIDDTIYIYTPSISNFYNFNFKGRKNLDDLGLEWSLERKLQNHEDTSKINCISWSDLRDFPDDETSQARFLNLPEEFNSRTSCELVTGSQKSLTLWRLYYKVSEGRTHLHSKLLWHQEQPNPVYMAKFSPNSTCIVSIGYCDRLVKLWYRLSFGIDTADFELHFIPHPAVVTDLRWKIFPLEGDTTKTPTGLPSMENSRAPSRTPSIYNSSSRLRASSDARSMMTTAADRRQHNVLFTVTAEALVRVYSTYRLDRGFEIIEEGQINMYQPGEDRTVQKFVTFIDNSIVEYGIGKLLGQSDAEESGSQDITLRLDAPKNTDALKQRYLLDKSLDHVDFCLVFGSDSSCELYSLTNLNLTMPAKVEITRLSQMLTQSGALQEYQIKLAKNCMPTDCRSICIQHILMSTYSNDTELTLAIQDLFKNTIRIVAFSFKDFLDFLPAKDPPSERDTPDSIPSTRALPVVEIGTLQDKLTGHNKSIRRLIRATDGLSMLSTTRFNENFLWFILHLGHGKTTLNKKSAIITPSPIKEAAIWRHGDYVITLVEGQLLCYDCTLSSQYHDVKTKLAPEICSIKVDKEGKPLSFFLLPENSNYGCHVVAIYPDKTYKSWEIVFPTSDAKAFIKDFDSDILPDQTGDLHLAAAVDPVGWTASIDENIRRDMLTTISKTGYVRLYSAEVSDARVSWHLKNEFMTDVENCISLSGSSVHKLAIISNSNTKLTIWDTWLGTLDHEELFEKDKLLEVDWTATSFHQAILSVGFSSYALMYTQMRYDYTNESSNFVPIKRVSIADQTTHDVGDSVWMSNGLYVSGAGNQFFIFDKTLDLNDDEITREAIGTVNIVSNDVFHLCAALNGPLPLFHPQFIIQVLFRGRFKVVELILKRLCEALRELDMGSDKDIESSLGISADTFLYPTEETDAEKRAVTYDSLMTKEDNEESDMFSVSIADTLMEKLQKYKLPFLTGHQQITLSTTIDIMKEMLLKYRKILDFNALRYYLGLRLFQLNATKGMGAGNKTVTMRDVNFALHSDNKDLIYNIINESSNSKIDWHVARRYGLAYWLEQAKLIQAMEVIARNQFMKYQDSNEGKKDPSQSALFYVALRKKQILLGLWKTSTGNPEQGKMVKFLSNDFTNDRWKKAANKNAFVLLSKHRYMDAAYFFLLGDSLNDCCDVIIQKLKDVPLAIAVARTYEKSDHGPGLRRLISRHILPRAVDNNDRWSISWCFWAFNDRPALIQCLLKPIDQVITDIQTNAPDFEPSGTKQRMNTFKNEDPVLLVLYNSLRNRNVRYYEGALELGYAVESHAVFLATLIYERMGCDWIGLFTMKNWKFVTHSEDNQSTETLRASSPVPEVYVPKRPGNLFEKYGIKPQDVPEMSNTKSPEKPLVKQNSEPTNGNSHRVQPPAAAFAEPDMSAFDF